MTRIKLLALAMLFCILPVVASGLPCDQEIIDEPGWFGNDLYKVEAAIQKLENAGAVVRVMMLDDQNGYSTLGHLAVDHWKGCEELQRPREPGEQKKLRVNVVMLLVAKKERQAWAEYGDEWKQHLDNNWTNIRTNTLNPHLQAGTFADGVVAVLNKFEKMYTYVPPPQSSAPVSSGPVTIVHERPSDGGKSVINILLVLAAIVIVILCVIFIPRHIRRRNERIAREQAAQAKAQLAEGGCTDSVNELIGNGPKLKAKLDGLAELAGEGELAELRRLVAAAKTATDKANNVNAGVLDTRAGDPNQDGLSEQTYAAIESAYIEVRRQITSAQTARDAADTALDEYKVVIARAPEAVAECGIALTKCVEAITAVKDSGFKIESVDPLLDEAIKTNDAAAAALEAKQYGKTLELVDLAQAQMQKATDAAEALPKKKEELDNAIVALTERIPGVVDQIKAGRVTWQYISGKYAEDSWEVIRGNGTEADKRVRDAGKTVVEATQAASMKEQDWAEALDAIEDGNKCLDQAESYMRSIQALKLQLEAAEQNAQQEIDLAQADIDKGQTFMDTFDPDVDDKLEVDLDGAREILAEARRELGELEEGGKPNYIKVVKLARKANAMADDLLDKAEDQHEVAERRRRRAVTSVREAQRSISAGEEYIEDHAYDVGNDASALVDQARPYLAKALVTADLDEKIRLADMADDFADRGLAEAQSDFRRAEDRRRREREEAERRRRAQKRRERQAADAAAAAARRRRQSYSHTSSSSSSSGSGGSWGSSSGSGSSGSGGGW